MFNQKGIITLLIILIVVLSIGLYSSRKINDYTMEKQKELIIEVNFLKKNCDSLEVELNTEKIQTQRYESVIDIAEQEMSCKCKKELRKILSQTE